jgi:hypothetical protein
MTYVTRDFRVMINEQSKFSRKNERNDDEKNHTTVIVNIEAYNTICMGRVFKNSMFYGFTESVTPTMEIPDYWEWK